MYIEALGYLMVKSMLPSYVITKLSSEYILVWGIQGSFKNKLILIFENYSWQQADNLAFLVS